MIANPGPLLGVSATLEASMSQRCSWARLRAWRPRYQRAAADPEFWAELGSYLKQYVGRPSPLYLARRLTTEHVGGAKIYLKREDLNHTGAHKINNTLGQALLTRRMGKPRIIAETRSRPGTA